MNRALFLTCIPTVRIKKRGRTSIASELRSQNDRGTSMTSESRSRKTIGLGLRSSTSLISCAVSFSFLFCVHFSFNLLRIQRYRIDYDESLQWFRDDTTITFTSSLNSVSSTESTT